MCFYTKTVIYLTSMSQFDKIQTTSLSCTSNRNLYVLNNEYKEIIAVKI